jgi:starvation-inducible DNA-binding protein
MATTTTTRQSSQTRSPNGSEQPSYTVPGMTIEQSTPVIATLQRRLDSLTDLSLTLKHIHWNVIGPHFIAVHTMLDPQYEAVSLMVDHVAERLATLGGSPQGTPGGLVARRDWDDYSIGRADAISHLAALDLVYSTVISEHREAIEQTEKPDPVTQDMLIEQSGQLEQFQWFVRAHLENAGGHLANEGTTTEQEAADSVAGAAGR